MKTSTYTLVTAALKILGLVLAVRALQAFGQLAAVQAQLGALEDFGIGKYILTIGVTALSLAALALLLLFRTSQVSRWLMAPASAEGEGAEVELGAVRELTAGGLVVAGCVVAMQAMPSLITNVAHVTWMMGRERRPLYEAALQGTYPNILVAALTVAIGLLVARRASRSLGPRTTEPSFDHHPDPDAQ